MADSASYNCMLEDITNIFKQACNHDHEFLHGNIFRDFFPTKPVILNSRSWRVRGRFQALWHCLISVNLVNP